MFSKMQKSVVLFWFQQLCSSDGIWLSRAHFVVCYLWGEQELFAVFETTSFKSFFRIPLTHAHTCLLKTRVILPNFWCFGRMTLREIEQFVLESSLVLFVVDHFRLHRFFHKKHNEKVDFLVFVLYRCEFLPQGIQCSILV